MSCFADEERKLLGSFKKDLEVTNSPRRCMNMCRTLKYQYAGTENGYGTIQYTVTLFSYHFLSMYCMRDLLLAHSGKQKLKSIVRIKCLIKFYAFINGISNNYVCILLTFKMFQIVVNWLQYLHGPIKKYTRLLPSTNAECQYYYYSFLQAY